jgi:hypothetical protein
MTKAMTMDCFMIIFRKLHSKNLHQRTATNKVKPLGKYVEYTQESSLTLWDQK